MTNNPYSNDVDDLRTDTKSTMAKDFYNCLISLILEKVIAKDKYLNHFQEKMFTRTK